MTQATKDMLALAAKAGAVDCTASSFGPKLLQFSHAELASYTEAVRAQADHPDLTSAYMAGHAKGVEDGMAKAALTGIDQATAKECREIANALKREYGHQFKVNERIGYDFSKHPYVGRAGVLLMRAANFFPPPPGIALSMDKEGKE